MRHAHHIPGTIEKYCAYKLETRSKILLVLPRDATLSAVYAVVVCLCVRMCVSVCLSVTLRYCIKTAKCRITQIMPHNSPGTLFF